MARKKRFPRWLAVLIWIVATPLLATLKRGTGRKTRRARMQGDELRAAVIGAGVSGRITTDEDGADTDMATVGAGSDQEATDAVHQPADKLLTHPPRPRKKRRR